MQQHRNKLQLIWGAALSAMGVAVFFRIPQIMPRIEEMTQMGFVSGVVRFCFYFMGALLIGGGVKKLVDNLKASGGDVDDEKAGKF